MGKVELSKRLQEVAKFVKNDQIILDIGSDHAYLPIYLIQEKLIPAAIAGEVVKGPYKKTKEQVVLRGLSEKISTRLGSGFDVLGEEEDIGSAFICGMGGILIAQIIEKGLADKKIDQNTRLILQPNNNEQYLRQLLMDQQFKIDEERIVKENDKYYEVIVANKSKGEVNYSDAELIFGPHLLFEKTENFELKWQAVRENNQAILKKLNKKNHKDKIREITWMNQQIEKGIE